jgi:hypothetical protein
MRLFSFLLEERTASNISYKLCTREKLSRLAAMGCCAKGGRVAIFARGPASPLELRALASPRSLPFASADSLGPEIKHLGKRPD